MAESELIAMLERLSKSRAAAFEGLPDSRPGGPQAPQRFDTGLNVDTGNQGRGYTNEGVQIKQNPYEGTKFVSTQHLGGIGKLANPGRFAAAMDQYEPSTNVDDRRLTDKTIPGYKGLVESADKHGLSQVPSYKAFMKRRGDFEGAGGDTGVPMPRNRTR